jgi:hypothetical protein
VEIRLFVVSHIDKMLLYIHTVDSLIVAIFTYDRHPSLLYGKNGVQ